MKPSSEPKKISPAKARNAALLNQLGTPGMGTLIAGRWLEGTLQLLVFLAGFVLFCAWALHSISQYYSLMSASFTSGDTSPPPSPGWSRSAFLGVVLCVGSWFWSLATSINLVREAGQTSIQTLKNFGASLVKLNEAQIASALAALPAWQRREQVISRTYEFKDFPAAMKFVNHVAELAEAAQHHPDIDVRWNKVTLALTTHDAGGLTAKDFALARECDARTAT